LFAGGGLSPKPSPSESFHWSESHGKSSFSSPHPSPSESGQPKYSIEELPKTSGQESAEFPKGLSPYPSPSSSLHCVGSVGNKSGSIPLKLSPKPSPS
tara:strand:+ start:554 stop:847 length:294 start_codon:yes stop_codon:yes gene_type:complete